MPNTWTVVKSNLSSQGNETEKGFCNLSGS